MNKYLIQLDGLRFIAVLLVMTAHWFSFDIAFIKDTSGPAGVNLFFVLSGFLITGILIANKDSGISATTLLKQFYIRRFLRIFPLFYAVVIVGALAFVQGAREYFFYHITYTSNYIIALQEGGIGHYTHLWSLCVEEQFYIVFPFLILATPKRYYLKLFYTLLALAVFSRIMAYLLMGNTSLSLWVSYAFTPGCFDAFAIGAILAYYFRYEPEQLTLILSNKLIFFSFLAAYAVCTLFSWFVITRTLFSVFAFWLIGTAAVGGFKGVMKFALENRAINYLGRITYGLYVYHYFMPFLFKRFGVQTPYNGVLYFIAAVVIASASWFLFERPINKLKKYFEYNAADKSPLPRKWFRLSLGLNAVFILSFLAVVIKYEPQILTKFKRNHPGQANIVMYGDSRIQLGDWEAGLQRADVINSGISGSTTTELLDSIQSRVISLRPKICFIQAGINDIRSRVQIDSTINAYKSMIDTLIANKIIVVVNSVIPITKDPFQYEVADTDINNKVEELNARLSELCKSSGAEYLNINNEMSENKRLKLDYSLDGVHIKKEGFDVWFTYVNNCLIRHRI